MENNSSFMGYRLISGSELKIESKCIVIDRPFTNSTLQYVTHVVNAIIKEVLTPTFSSLVYDEDKKIFLIEDYIELPFQLVHISLCLDLKLNVIGNMIYNDYFDGVDFISGLGNEQNEFAPYEYYKYDIYRKILSDKDRRNKEHKDANSSVILKYIENKNVEV